MKKIFFQIIEDIFILKKKILRHLHHLVESLVHVDGFPVVAGHLGEAAAEGALALLGEDLGVHPDVGVQHGHGQEVALLAELGIVEDGAWPDLSAMFDKASTLHIRTWMPLP